MNDTSFMQYSTREEDTHTRSHMPRGYVPYGCSSTSEPKYNACALIVGQERHMVCVCKSKKITSQEQKECHNGIAFTSINISVAHNGFVSLQLIMC